MNMHWSHENPLQTGWYWYRETDDHNPEIVYITMIYQEPNTATVWQVAESGYELDGTVGNSNLT